MNLFFPDVFDFDPFGFNHLNNFNISFDSNDFEFGSWLLPVGIAGLMQGALFVVNIVYTILATIRTNEGQTFEYPITIKFIK